MNPTEFLDHFAENAAPVQKELLECLKKEASHISPIGVEMVEVLTDLTRRGKWIKGTLTVLGYRCAGQEENEEILKAGVAIDIIHSALLIADDVMDKAELRRGKSSVHRVYEQQAAKYNQKDAAHFGISMAVNLSLTGLIFAEHIFARVALAKDKVAKAQSFLNRYLVDVGFGQGMDVTYQKNLVDTIDDVLRIHRLKAAYYTIAGPLQVGGILGGAKLEQLRAMEKYGGNIGVAFQLRDDEFGLFGDEQEIGKPADSDLKEGKNSVLLVEAFAQANPQQRMVLEQAFGNREATEEQLQAVRKIVVGTGSLKFSQDMCEKLLTEGKKYIPKITNNKDLQDTLYNLANFMIERDR